MLSRLVCGDEGVLRADQPGPLLGVEGVGLLGAHQPGPLGGQPCLLRDAPAALHDAYYGVLSHYCKTLFCENSNVRGFIWSS